MKAFVLRAAAVALALLAIPSAADANWVGAGFSGSNQLTLGTVPPATGPRADGVINYAVYDNSANDFAAVTGFSGTATTQFGAGGLGAGRYIYLYQVVNNDPITPEHELTGMHLMVDLASINSAGFLLDTVFRDASGNVGPVGNIRLGLENPIPDVPLPAPNPTGFGTIAAAIETQSVTANNGDSLRFNFMPGTIPTDSFSSVLFVTSGRDPTFGQGRLVDGDTTAGFVPVPTPEPGTLALLGLGLPLLGWGYTRRLRAAKVAAEAAQ